MAMLSGGRHRPLLVFGGRYRDPDAAGCTRAGTGRAVQTSRSRSARTASMVSAAIAIGLWCGRLDRGSKAASPSVRHRCPPRHGRFADSVMTGGPGLRQSGPGDRGDDQRRFRHPRIRAPNSYTCRETCLSHVLRVNTPPDTMCGDEFGDRVEAGEVNDGDSTRFRRGLCRHRMVRTARVTSTIVMIRVSSRDPPP